MSTINRITLLVIFISLSFPFAGRSDQASAQAPVPLACGESIESVFSGDRQIHEYVIDADPGIALIIYAEERTGNYETLTVDMGLWAPNGFEIDSLTYGVGWSDSPDQTDVITTDWLTTAGQYSLQIISRTKTGGSYYLTVWAFPELVDTRNVQ